MTLSFSFSLFQNDVILGQTDVILSQTDVILGQMDVILVAYATGAGTIPTSKYLLGTAYFCTFYLIYLSVADATGASTVPTSK